MLPCISTAPGPAANIRIRCPGTNCTDVLATKPRCADPSWILCDNNGYFCCQYGEKCYNHTNTDGCASPEFKLGPHDIVLPTVQQAVRTAEASSTAKSFATPTPEPATDGGLSTSDKIAMGVGVPVGVATILGTWLAWKVYMRKKKGGGRSGVLKRNHDPHESLNDDDLFPISCRIISRDRRSFMLKVVADGWELRERAHQVHRIPI